MHLAPKIPYLQEEPNGFGQQTECIDLIGFVRDDIGGDHAASQSKLLETFRAKQ
jgi:hypothetical protein